MEQFYAGKYILLTGATGFLGKVILEKILRVLPQTKIYVVIRQKKGSQLLERLKKEIYESLIFETQRKSHPNFESYFFANIIPIAGDLLLPNLGLSPQDNFMLEQTVNIFINCAACVDFNARLDDAIQMNILGPLKAYELFRQMKKGLNFIHISTCYVNSDMNGFIEERIYEKGVDVVNQLEYLLQLKTDEFTQERTKQIIGSYPNTYTYTKYLCERILALRRDGKAISNLLNETTPLEQSLTIVRPSIIGSSNREPVEGWVDNVSAAGAIFLLGGLGIVNHVRGNPENIGDLIPVDFVSDYILVAAFYGTIHHGTHIMHSASSDVNPVTWGACTTIVLDYWNANLPQKKFAKPDFKIYQSTTLLKLNEIKRKFPSQVYERVAILLKNQNMIKNANKLKKVFKRSDDVAKAFEYFTSNQQIYQSSKLKILQDLLSPHDKMMYQLNVEDIDWPWYITHFAWGLHKFVLMEKVDPPSYSKRFNLTNQSDQSYFSDLQWILQKGKNEYSVQRNQLVGRILQSDDVRKLLHNKEDLQWAVKRCNTIFGGYQFYMVRFGAWLIHKFFKAIFDKIVVDQQMVNHLKELDKKASIILAPNHTSYIDILIIAYIFYAYQIGGIFFNASEQLSQIHLLGPLFRMCGGFFIDLKKQKNSNHQKIQEVLMTQYLKLLFDDNRNLELFIEGSRTRGGKLTRCRNPLFDILAKQCIAGQYSGQNIVVVPVSIKYERVVESESFTMNLLGEYKTQASFKHLLKSVPILNQNFGRIFVEFMPQIVLSEFCVESCDNNPEKSHLLGMQVMRTIKQSSAIMPTSIVASILLMNRTGISEDQVIQQCAWLSQEFQKRNKYVGSLSSGNTNTIQPIKAIQLLGKLITKRKDMFSVLMTPKVDYQNILLLAYYRNSLLNSVIDECVVSVSLVSFGIHAAFTDGVEATRLIEEITFLQQLLSQETVEFQSPQEVLNYMQQLGVITLHNQKIKVINQKLVNYFCSLIWPFIDSYYIALAYLHKLNTPQPKEELIENIQYYAETLYFERVIEHYEGTSRETIKNALKQLKYMKVVIKANDKHKTYSLACDVASLNDLEFHVQRFIKHSYAKSINSMSHIMDNTPQMKL